MYTDPARGCRLSRKVSVEKVGEIKKKSEKKKGKLSYRAKRIHHRAGRDRSGSSQSSPTIAPFPRLHEISPDPPHPKRAISHSPFASPHRSSNRPPSLRVDSSCAGGMREAAKRKRRIRYEYLHFILEAPSAARFLPTFRGDALSQR